MFSSGGTKERERERKKKGKRAEKNKIKKKKSKINKSNTIETSSVPINFFFQGSSKDSLKNKRSQKKQEKEEKTRRELKKQNEEGRARFFFFNLTSTPLFLSLSFSLVTSLLTSRTPS